MDVNVRFWNECRNIVETRYCDLKFLDRPNAENLFESVGDASNGLWWENFLQLTMNGLNVNWKVLKKTDEILVKNDYSKIINIGCCPQHTVHSAFKTGATNDWDAHKILKSMFWLLHDSPAHRNIYVTEGGSDVFPLRYYSVLLLLQKPNYQSANKNLQDVKDYCIKNIRFLSKYLA